MAIRHVRDEDSLAVEINRTRRGVRDAQRPTGTETRRTADVAEQAAVDALAAAQAAGDALYITEGLFAVVPSVDVPTTRPGGAELVQGDQWWKIGTGSTAGQFVGVAVWDGDDWQDRQIVASSVLVPSSVGNVLLAEGAVDAMIIQGARIYGGYIEAPVIASSENLGTGANALADPQFTSTINTSWVASGHLGDAAKTQTDTVTWDQTPVVSGTSYRRQGSMTVITTFPTMSRVTGSLMFPNYAWTPANRSLNNPYTYGNTFVPAAGESDPTFTAITSPGVGTKVARTTYLTNANTIALGIGETWTSDVNLAYALTHADTVLGNVDVVVEVVNASTSAVIWSYTASDDELRAKRLRATWVSTFAGNVKFRIKTVYLAAGGASVSPSLGTGPLRKLGAGSFVRAWTGATQVRNWPADATGVLPTNPESYCLKYGAHPSYILGYGTGSLEVDRLAAIDVRATSAIFARVAPEEGWRLSKEGGLELFNSFGAKTGQLDGEANFLAGEFATAQSGRRAQMEGAEAGFYSAADALIGGMRLNAAGGAVELFGEVNYAGSPITYRAGFGSFVIATGSIPLAATFIERNSHNLVQFNLAIQRSAWTTGGVTTLGTMPVGFRPVGATVTLPCVVYGAGSPYLTFAQIATGGDVLLYNSPTNGQTWIAAIPGAYKTA